MAIPGVGADSLLTNYTNYCNDPCFIQANNSPNYYQLAQAQTQTQTQTQQPVQTVKNNATLPSDSVQFKGASEQIENGKKKSNGAAWGIICGLITIGTAVLCKKAHKIGNAETMFGKIGDGLKQYFNKSAKAIGSWNFKNVKAQNELTDAKWYEKWSNTIKGWWNDAVGWVGKQNLKTNPAT